MKTVRDIMTSDVVRVSAETPLREAMEILSARHLSGAPVLAGERVVGVISMSDILGFLVTMPAFSMQEEREEPAQELEEFEGGEDEAKLAAGIPEDVWPAYEQGFPAAEGDPAYVGESVLDQHTVEDAMNNEVISIAPNASVKRAAAMMARHSIHRLLVMEKGFLKGIVSALDVARSVGGAAKSRQRRRRGASSANE